MEISKFYLALRRCMITLTSHPCGDVRRWAYKAKIATTFGSFNPLGQGDVVAVGNQI